ncbi:MAG: hypothetical protein M1839_002747 [Geoglossum umbratile]|nr:MAG: hypothetical protein M1839_002747 [Geoglossum umbratile]
MHLLPIATILAATLSVASANPHDRHHRSHHHGTGHHLTGTIGHPTGIHGTGHPSGTGGHHHNTTLTTKRSHLPVSSTHAAIENDPEVTGQAAGDGKDGTCTVTHTVTGEAVTLTVTVYETLEEPAGTGSPYVPPAIDTNVPVPPPAAPTESSTSPSPSAQSSTSSPSPSATSSTSSSAEAVDPTVDAAGFGQNKQVKPKSTTTKTTATPSPSSASPGGSPGTGKRGLAFNDANLANSFGGSGSQVSWGYDWGNSCGGKLKSDFMFVPMLWGLSSEKTGGWFKAADAAIAAGGKYLTSFNEPDHTGQANLSPSDAAAGYKTWMQPYAGKAKLGAPAVTNGGAPMGLTWLKSFLSACSGCTIDFVPIHWYDSASNVAYFKNYIQQVHTETGKQIWITEFAGSGSQDQQIAFLKTVMPWLDAQPYVERYSYFGVFEGSLVSGGAPSALGSTFNSYTGS